MKTLTFDVYSDIGHSWLKTSLSLIDKLNLRDKITSYSYMRKDNVYLEEDYDANIFLKTLEKNNIKYAFRCHNTNKLSKIRNYLKYPFWKEEH